MAPLAWRPRTAVFFLFFTLSFVFFSNSVLEEIFAHFFFLFFLQTEFTVRWSNFDRQDPNEIGVFLQSTEATPCGYHHVHGRHSYGSPVKNR